MIQENIKLVEENIKKACEKVGRDVNEVTLIAVSKTKPYTAIEEALPTGVKDYGENKVQELVTNMKYCQKISVIILGRMIQRSLHPICCISDFGLTKGVRIPRH